jgi:superfamily II DNA or RNA helicase
MDKLLVYQIPHVEKLLTSLNKYNIAIDASQTGCGKSYCGLAIAKQLNLKPLIICPKTIKYGWERVCRIFEIEPLMIINYEQMIASHVTTDEKQNQIIEDANKPHLEFCKKVFVNDEFSTFQWMLPENTIVIFDEVHRCKNKATYHFALLTSIRQYITNKIKCIILSATIADKIKYFIPFGYLLKWYNSLDGRAYNKWIKERCNQTGFSNVKLVHHLLFPWYGSRIKISELGDLFPQNQIIPDCYNMENAKQIEEQYDAIRQAMADLREKKEGADCILAIITRARQMIELLKFPTFCELISDHLDDGSSVVIFVNFNETLHKLAEVFDTTSIILGNQTNAERQRIIDDFQSNRTNIIIANNKAGGVGISLHDIHGGHQRVSIISPTWSAQDTMQTLGRIHRAEGKTPAIQKFVFCAGTIEEYICEKLREKLNNLSMINDGVLHPFPAIETEKKGLSEFLEI